MVISLIALKKYNFRLLYLPSFLNSNKKGDVIMPTSVRRASRKTLTSEEESIFSSKEVLSPSEIGYYGRPITQLKKDELISALTELSKMYLECKKKIKKY
jgi:hypothetical protein